MIDQRTLRLMAAHHGSIEAAQRLRRMKMEAMVNPPRAAHNPFIREDPSCRS